MSGNFGSIVVCDFEYEVTPGDLPDVLCMAAHVLDENFRHARTIRLWRGQFGATSAFDVGADTLFAAYSAWAEMTCFKRLDWKFPAYIFDQHTAYLATSNILLPYNPDEIRHKPRKRLPDARAVPMGSKAGSASTRTRSPKRSATAPGAAATAPRKF